MLNLIRTLTVSLVCGYNAEPYHDTDRKFGLWIQCLTLDKDPGRKFPDRKFGLWIQCLTFKDQDTDRKFGLWIQC